MEIKDVGQRIARLRKEMGLSQMGLAEKLNVSDKAVSKWENGGMPGIDLLPCMSKLFNVSIDYLLTGKEENNSSDGVESTATDDEPTVSTEAVSDIVLNEEQNDAPIDYVCPKCNNVNHNPTDRCKFCYHEFDEIEMMEAARAVEDEPEVEEVAIQYDEETGKPICPKCNRINPYLDTYCIYCYHEFKKTRSEKKAPHNSGFYGTTYKNGYSYTQNQPPVIYPSAPTSQAGCLLYFIAYLIPLIGLILGLTRKDKSLTIFSIAFMIINFLALILLLGLSG